MEMACKEVFFSIIIPVYNIQDYIEECIKSVVSQQLTDYEMILIDDGSTDRSGFICDQYASAYECVVCIRQENAGLSEARNSGIKRARGKYLIFLDGDDLLALISLKTAIDNNLNPDFMISRRETLDINKSSTIPCEYYFGTDYDPKMDRVELYEKLQGLSDCWLGAWIFSVSREFLISKDLFFYPGIFHEDEEWVPRLMFQAETIGFNNSYLYVYRINREGSITATFNIKRMFDKLHIVDLLSGEFQIPKYDRTVCECVRDRECKILFGIICQFMQYKKNQEFKVLVKDIKPKLDMLRYSHKRVHRFVFFFLKVFGVRMVGKFLLAVKKGE